MFKQLPTMISELNKLGIALKALDGMNLATVGVNTGNLDAFRSAIKRLSTEQAVFALANKGATEEQIRQILITKQSEVADVEAALAKARLTTATAALNGQEVIELATNKGITSERAKEIATALGLIATEEGQVVSKKQLTVATLKQAGATDAEIASILGLNATETANIGITNILTGAVAKLWAVITAHPIGAILTAVGAVAVGVIAYINKSNKDAQKAIVETHKKAQQALDDTKTALSDDKSELESVNSELDSTKQKIQDIASQGTITLTEQNELDKLSTVKTQLETQKSLLENNIKLKQKSAALDAKNLLGTQVEMDYSDIQDGKDIVSHKESYTYEEHAKYEANSLKNAYNIYMKALRDGDAEKQKIAQELIDVAGGDAAELTSSLLEIVESFKYDDGTIIEGYEDLYNQYMGFIYNLQSLTNPEMFLDIAKQATEGTNIDYEKAISDGYAMAYDGEFDIDKLNQDFVKALADNGIDTSTIEYFFKLKQQEYQSVVDNINKKYNPDNVLKPTYLTEPGHVDTKEETAQKELDSQNYEQQKQEVQNINDELTEYAKEHPIEFQLISSYDENFSTLDKYIEEEKSKSESAIQDTKSQLEDLSKNGNVDLTIRPVIDSSAMQAVGWDVEDGSIATTFTQGEFIWQGDEENGQYVYVHYTPILPDGTVLTPDQLSDYLYDTLEGSPNILDADNKGLVLKVDTDLQGISEDDIKALQEDGKQSAKMSNFLNQMGQWDDSLHDVQEGYYLTGDSVDYVDNAVNRLVEDAKKAKGEISDETSLSSTDILAQVQALSTGLDQLDKIYADVYNKEDFDWSSILNNDSFTEAFGQLGDAYTNFIETISNSPSDIEACQSAFDDLATAYIYNSDVLDNVTEATKDATIAMLEQMGIENAAELVTNSLAQNENYLAAQKILVANATFDLANATAAEIDALAQENNMTETTKQQIALLALQKQLCNQTSIMTDGDIKNLQALAEQAGATQTAIAAIKLTNQKIETAGSGRRYSNNPEDAKKLWQKTYDDIYASISNKAQLKNVGGTSNSGISTNSGYKPSYTGGTKTKSAKDSASSGSGSNSSDSSEAEDNYEETIDFFEQRVKVLQQALDILDKSLENVLGSDRKNQLLSSQSDIVSEEMKNYTDALSMYQAKANEALSKIDSSLRDKVVNGAVAITDFIGEGNEDTVEAIQDYQSWAEKIGDCREQLAELAQQLREIELSKFNNIVEEFTTKTEFFTDANSNIQKQIDLFEQAGQIIGEGFYDAQKQNSQKQLNLLEEEKSRLVQQLNNSLSSGKIQQGTDEWVEMVNTLSDLDGSILDCKKSIEEMDDAILNLHTEQFERIQTAFSNIKTELEDIYDLIGDSDDVALDDGTWTSAGITRIGLLAQQYETAKLQAQRYGEEIDQLNSDYLAGKYSATEYAEKLASLTQSQYDSLKAAESIKDSIVDINQSRVDIMTDAINKETEAYNELIQAKKDALSSEQDLYEYRKSISEKTKSITDIERQLAALANDNSSSAKAQKAKLKNQLEEAKQDLTDYEYEQDIKNRQDALDKEQEAYEKSQQERIDALNAYLENRNQVISDSFETVKANTSVVADQLTQIAQTHGVNISNVITSAWAQGSNAIASYGNVLSAQSSVFLGNLLNVQSGIYALNVEANNTANALGYMFSTSASTLLSQLQSSYNSIGNVNITTQALRDSLVNTLERGYDVSSISNGLNSITDSANSATSAVNNLKSALGGSSSPSTSSSSSSGTSSKASSSVNNALSNSNRKDYYVYTQDGSYVRSNLTATQAFTTLMDKRKTELASITRLLPSKYEIGKYAQGGMVSKSKNNPLNSLAQLLGEDTMIAAKEGESVLTPEQTANLKALAENGENWLKAVSIDTSRFFTNSAPLNISKIQTEQPINISVDKFVEVQGSIDSATMPQVNAAIKKSINDLGTKLNKQIRYGGT